MNNKLSAEEKQHIMDTIQFACMGTPLQPNAEFAGQYLGTVLIAQLENWDTVKLALSAGVPSVSKPA